MWRKQSEYLVSTQDGRRVYVHCRNVYPVLRGVIKANESVCDIETILKQRIKKREELLKDPDADPEMIKYLDGMIKNLQDTLQRKSKARVFLKDRMLQVIESHNERCACLPQKSKEKQY